MPPDPELTSPPTPGGNPPTPPTPPAFTHTKEQLETAVSDALSTAGRDAQTLGTERTQLEADRTAHDSAVSAFRTLQDEAADAVHKDNPQALTTLRTTRELERGMADLKRGQEAHTTAVAAFTERESAVSKQTHATLAGKISTEFGVAIEPLLKNTDGSEAQMRELAPLLSKTGTPTPPDTTPPDSGIGGGGEGISMANIDDLMVRVKEFGAPQQKAITEAYSRLMATGKIS